MSIDDIITVEKHASNVISATVNTVNEHLVCIRNLGVPPEKEAYSFLSEYNVCKDKWKASKKFHDLLRKYVIEFDIHQKVNVQPYVVGMTSGIALCLFGYYLKSKIIFGIGSVLSMGCAAISLYKARKMDKESSTILNKIFNDESYSILNSALKHLHDSEQENYYNKWKSK